jgi:membrane complex biogenesis BtpA family protein
MKFKSLFPKKAIIGAVHFMPLPGHAGYSGMSETLDKALFDSGAFINGGVDALIFENNYDYPHSINVSSIVGNAIEQLVDGVAPLCPFGVSVLWNDYKSAMQVAKKTGGRFIRVPVFVDKVKTQYGTIEPTSTEAISYREKLNAEDILLLTDIHVKHAQTLGKMSLVESAKKAVCDGSDGLIITGKWTGDAPTVDDLIKVRNAVGDFPIIVGSGATAENIKDLLKFADAAIVSTALKSGEAEDDQVNVKSYHENIDISKVKKFMNQVKETTKN